MSETRSILHVAVSALFLIAPMVRADPASSFPPGRESLEEIRTLVRGKVLTWDPRTRRITLVYDFGEHRQLSDWSGGLTDEGGRLRANKAKLSLAPRFSAVERVDYEGYYVSGKGRVCLWLFDGLCACFGGAGGKHLLYQSDWRRPVIATPNTGFARNALMKAGLELSGDAVGWTLDDRVLGKKPLQHKLAVPIRVGFGHEWSDTRYDNVRIVGRLDPEWLNIRRRELKDLHIIKARLVEQLAASETKTAADEVRRWADSLDPDGAWPDIDYACRSVSAWDALNHLKRIAGMARAYRGDTPELGQSPALRNRIGRALDCWQEKGFPSPQWWYSQIGVPLEVASIMLLMEADLSEAQKAKGLRILRRCALRYPGSRGTGQNLIWRAKITLMRGCLEANPEAVAGALGAVAGTIRITTGEGVQPDLSFHQHGPLLYSAGYGVSFSIDCAEAAFLARGTGYAFSPEKIDILSRHILDGQQWMIRGRTFDYGAWGRGISTRGPTTARVLILPCERMAALDTPRKAEFEAFAARLRGETSEDDSSIVGNRHFWRSDFMVHRRRDYQVSARMASVRTKGSESGNGEGLKNYHLADGTTYILVRGDEYKDIFPVWHWRRIPGTTCEQTTGGFPNMEWGRGMRGKTSFVGGVTDGTYGVAACDFAKGSLKARKAWFFFDREFVCLGSGITCSGGNPVYTIVNQCLRETDTHLPAGKLGRAGERTGNLGWVHQDGIGYVLFDAHNASLRVGAQKGSWREINRRYDNTPVSEEVFSLWLDHGREARNAAYRYIVRPAIALEAFKKYADAPPVKILSNTPKVQAVQHTRTHVTGIAFFEPQQIEMTGGLVLSVDQPCLLLLRKQRDTMRLAISNPHNKALTVHVEVNLGLGGEGVEWSQAEGRSRITFDLPDGPQAGRSVMRALSIR